MSDIAAKITATVPIFFFVYNLQKEEVEYISPQFYELASGVEDEEENSLKKCIDPEFHEAFDDFFQGLSEENRYEGSVELKANNKFRNIRWIELNTFPVVEKNLSEVKQVVGHIVDTTQKKEMYDLLSEEKEHITNILNMAVHDLRAPFNRINMIAQLLEKNMTEEEYVRHKTYLDMLRKQEEDSMALIQSLLRLATLKGEVNSLDLNVHDLRGLVKTCVSNQQPRLKEKALEVRFEFPDQTVKARLDAVLFLQVLENLLSNAIKYTPKGGEILWSLSLEDQHVQLSIRDTGIGIPEKYQEKLFRDFQGLRRKGLEGEDSIGLGLFICKEIVKMHQGEIHVESKEGEGTTFKITLPFPESSAAYY